MFPSYLLIGEWGKAATHNPHMNECAGSLRAVPQITKARYVPYTIGFPMQEHVTHSLRLFMENSTIKNSHPSFVLLSFSSASPPARLPHTPTCLSKSSARLMDLTLPSPNTASKTSRSPRRRVGRRTPLFSTTPSLRSERPSAFILSAPPINFRLIFVPRFFFSNQVLRPS